MEQAVRRIMEVMMRLQVLNRDLWAAIGMPKGEFIALSAIEEKDAEGEGGITVSNLSKRMRVTPPAMSQLLSVLVRKNLVKRTPDPRDRRVVCISLSASGQTALAAAKIRFNEIIARFWSELDEGEIQEAARTLERICSVVESVRPNIHPPCPCEGMRIMNMEGNG